MWIGNKSLTSERLQHGVKNSDWLFIRLDPPGKGFLINHWISTGLYFKKQCREAAQEYIQKRFKLSFDNGPTGLVAVLVYIQIT